MKKEKTQCIEKVWNNSGWFSYPCSRNAIVQRDGKWFCKIHDPEYKKSRDKQREEKYQLECCKKCKYHFSNDYYGYCPLCGTIRKKI